MAKTWKLQVTEGELQALINYNIDELTVNYSTDVSARIHDLTKRLNKETPEVEYGEANNRPEPTEQKQPIPEGWG